MSAVTGLHHVTVVSGNAQQNLDFYVGVLGMRLVKRSVNQDDPGTYHLFYADGEGHPGSELTFFPWAHLPAGRPGAGLTNEVGLAVPPGSLDYWAARLAGHGVSVGARERRFGEPALAFQDPHGLAIALVETPNTAGFAAWDASPVPAEHQVRRLHTVRLVERALEPTARFLEQALGFARVGEEGGWHRFAVGGGRSGEIVEVREDASAPRGAQGHGSVHHVAFRVPDDAAERAAQQRVLAAGGRATPVIDRFWFKSVYFQEPGGALFEIATDGPGFTVDEDPATLGERLILPPFLEPHRAEIERRLPPLAMPGAAATR